MSVCVSLVRIHSKISNLDKNIVVSFNALITTKHAYILREQFSYLLVIVNILSEPFSPEMFKYVCGWVFLHVNCLTLLQAAVIATVSYTHCLQLVCLSSCIALNLKQDGLVNQTQKSLTTAVCV